MNQYNFKDLILQIQKAENQVLNWVERDKIRVLIENQEKTDIEKARQWFGRANTREKNVESKTILINKWKALIDRWHTSAESSISNPDQILGMMGGSGFKGEGGRVQKYGVLIIDAEKEIEKLENELADVSGEIQSVIDKLSDGNYRAILEQRFLKGATWAEVANVLRYSDNDDGRYMRRLGNKALLEASVFIPKTVPHKDLVLKSQ